MNATTLIDRTLDSLDRSALRARRRRSRLGHALRLVRLALRIRRERNQLAALDDDQLKDIGVTRAEADREAARPLHDIPDYRKARLYL